uniref:Small ribosomal subunit protein uS15m n=1 Tax=Simocephalus serrulatus TaxID=117539 RepID=A0A4Y7NNK8_9CRUS|nr:EOG090X09BQ [Simocephalus serrulatus]SVE94353.1 EOG090X09BQ [Simocephalus serrulatus]
MYHRLLQTVKPMTVELFSLDSRCSSLYKILGTQTRSYNEGATIEWVPPPKVSCLDPSKSGDRSPLPEVDLSRPQYKFSRFKPAVQFTDREDIPAEIRKIASLEFSPKNKQVQVIKHDVLSKIRRHEFDCSSLEAKIASLTIDIRNQQRHVKECKKDVISRVVCKENIEKRHSLLKHLRRKDYKRFEWLLEKLDIVYHTQPNPIVPVTRKGALTKLTTFYCDKIRNERLEAYKLELEKEKAVFAKEKAELGKWIEEEERELGLRS